MERTLLLLAFLVVSIICGAVAYQANVHNALDARDAYTTTGVTALSCFLVFLIFPPKKKE
jgi:hypothetical protein